MEIIAQHGSIFLIMACVFGFFMAWGIGATRCTASAAARLKTP